MTTDRDYRVTIARFREALLLARGLTGAERQVALLMLERSNREAFDSFGRLESWMAEGTIAKCAGLSERKVRQARRRLLIDGAFTRVSRGGGGAGDTSRYAFNVRWLDKIESVLKSTGVFEAWKGEQAFPLETTEGGTGVPSQGAKTGTEGGTGVPQNPMSNPLTKPLDRTPAEDNGLKNPSFSAQAKPEASSPTPNQSAVIISLAGARRPKAPKPWHVASGVTREIYAPDAAERAYLAANFPMAFPDIDLEIGKWRCHEYRKEPKNLRDSLRNWVATAEGHRRERARECNPERRESDDVYRGVEIDS